MIRVSACKLCCLTIRTLPYRHLTVYAPYKYAPFCLEQPRKHHLILMHICCGDAAVMCWLLPCSTGRPVQQEGLFNRKACSSGRLVHQDGLYDRTACSTGRFVQRNSRVTDCTRFVVSANKRPWAACSSGCSGETRLALHVPSSS